MLPFIYYSESFSIPSFAFSLMMASLLATFVAYKMAARRGLSQVVILDLAMIGTIMAIVGGRLFHVVVEEWAYYNKPDSLWDRLKLIIAVWNGGFVSYGAFIGLALGWFVYLKARKQDILRYLDHLCLFSGPFIILMVRMGCLMVGCCYGQKSSFDDFEYLLYITFTNRASDAGRLHYGEHLWPTQIWAMTYSMILFLICYWQERRIKFKGQVMLTFLSVYAVFRTGLEFFRGDPDRGVYSYQTLNFSLSTAQITSLISLTLCGILYFVLKKKFPLEKPYPRVSPNTQESQTSAL